MKSHQDYLFVCYPMLTYLEVSLVLESVSQNKSGVFYSLICLLIDYCWYMVLACGGSDKMKLNV